MVERDTYVISLPGSFPEQVLYNLDNLDRNTERKISNIYPSITKKTYTSAASSRDALGHLFFREIPLKNDAKLFTKMFSSDSDKYAFLVPRLDMNPEYNHEEALDFRVMELAINISEARSCHPSKVYSEARELMSLFRKRR